MGPYSGRTVSHMLPGALCCTHQLGQLLSRPFELAQSHGPLQRPTLAELHMTTPAQQQSGSCHLLLTLQLWSPFHQHAHTCPNSLHSRQPYSTFANNTQPGKQPNQGALNMLRLTSMMTYVSSMSGGASCSLLPLLSQLLLELCRCSTTCRADCLLPTLELSCNQESVMLLRCDALIVETWYTLTCRQR